MDFVIEDNILKGVEIPMNMDHKLGQLIYDTLNKNPNHVAEIAAESGEQTTCAEMKDRSVRCAVWMMKLGISPQDIVVAVTHNRLDSYIPLFATFFVDAIISAWSPNITLHTARRYMKMFKPKLIFTREITADVLKEAAKLENSSVELVVFGKHTGFQSLDDILNSQTIEEVMNFKVANEKKPEDVAAIVLSSGTTGLPKGVMLAKKGLRSLLPPVEQKKRATNKKLLSYSSIQWLSGIYFVIQSLLDLNTRILPADYPDAKSFFETAEKNQVEVAVVPPFLICQVAKMELDRNYDLQSLKRLIFGGCKLTKQVLKDFRSKIPSAVMRQNYATTENGLIASVTPETKNIESIGYVVANCQIKFVDSSSSKALGPNQNGELCVKSPNTMIGYYGDLEGTSRAFDEEGWYRTGDIGYYNEDGEMFIVDRIKEVVKYKSHRISPTEIEEVLLSHPGVQEAAVVAIPHELDGHWPAAFVVKMAGSEVSADKLMDWISVLEDYKRLRGGIHFLDYFPHTGSGKIAKNELKQLAESLIDIKNL